MNSHKQVGLFMAIFGFVVFMITTDEVRFYRMVLKIDPKLIFNRQAMHNLDLITTYTPLIGIGLIILGAVVFIVGFKLEKNEKK